MGKKIGTSVVLLTMLSTCLWAKEVDRSTRSDPAGEFRIGFCARPSADTFKSLPGHAFVSFNHIKPSGDLEFMAIGHTVGPGVPSAQASWSFFGAPVPGLLKKEKYSSIMQNCLDVKVDRNDYDRAIELTKSPLQTMGLVRDGAPLLEAYKLGDADCMNFMIAVANTLVRKGLVVPKRGTAEIPMQYMQRLIAAN